jgi:hypothetical protein
MTHSHFSIGARVATLAAAVLLNAPAQAGERCYDFGRLADNTRWEVGAEIQIPIGTVHVRDLLVNGTPYVELTANKFLLAKADQQMAGGNERGEVYGKNVALQFVPGEPVTRISMKLAHQPGPNGALPNFVQVNNGQRHEFRGSLAQMHGKTIGGAR